MIRPVNDIARVKRRIQDHFLKQVDVTVNLGRNKTADFTGRLTRGISIHFQAGDPM